MRTLLAADDQRDLDALAGHRREPRLERGALRRAGRVAADRLVDGRVERVRIPAKSAAICAVPLDSSSNRNDCSPHAIRWSRPRRRLSTRAVVRSRPWPTSGPATTDQRPRRRPRTLDIRLDGRSEYPVACLGHTYSEFRRAAPEIQGATTERTKPVREGGATPELGMPREEVAVDMTRTGHEDQRQAIVS